MSEKDKKQELKKDPGAPPEPELKEEEDKGAPPDPNKDGDDKEDTEYWKSEAARLQKDNENYKQALTQKRQLRKKPVEPEGVNEDEDLEEEEDDKPVKRSELKKAIVEAVTPILTQSSVAQKVDAEIARLVKDPAKREVVKHNYLNRIRQMGTSDDAIKNDVAAALDLAEAPRLKKISSELKRKTDMQETPPLSGSEKDKDVFTKGHQFSAEQVAALTQRARRLGVDPEKFIKQTWQNSRK